MSKICDIIYLQFGLESTNKKPLNCSDKTNPVYLVLFVGEHVSFAPPLPYIFDLVQMQFICFFWYRWTAVYPNSFYPVTGLPIKRTAVTQTAHYPVAFGIGPKFSLHVHCTVYTYFNTTQNIWVLFSELHRLRSNFYVAFLHFEFGGFYCLCFDYFGFSLILKRDSISGKK